uniref:Uncharacterized protein n=1 Tax=Physcomitrium patens TaxID=3218 RepID=A0A2K1KG74_PHYPA|nr:hypothetical protein PHYPA_009159 [Physcomitrium patens]
MQHYISTPGCHTGERQYYAGQGRAGHPDSLTHSPPPSQTDKERPGSDLRLRQRRGAVVSWV